ncbi:hypothetical protein [Paraburkholderia adhaesiva]|uniref:hypothetical protein n=1 Tax=Paraburkholderia adhaesiva TaxID=2883244 RepID=UPI001F38DC37|nr:hypothetical protein [Paraburkholderia adhaesiva]
MKTVCIDVTPALARRWLKHNQGNRRVRASWVQTLKAAFERGEYVMSHQGVAFSDTGELLDGQHRLMAIAAQPDERAFPMLVTRGLSRDTVFQVMDSGQRRTLSDLTGHGHQEIEIARLIARQFSSAPVTPTLLIPLCERLAPWLERLLDGSHALVRTWSSAPMRAGAVLTMMMGHDVS